MYIDKKFVYFDIETSSNYPSYDNLLKDKPLLAASFNKKHNKENNDLNHQYLNQSGLYPEYGKIISFSYGYYKNTGDVKISSIIEESEEKLITTIHNMFNTLSDKNKLLCGFNIKQFDIPWLIKKMIQYDLTIPKNLNIIGKKPWELNHIFDICELWKFGGFDTASQSEICEFLNIQNSKEILSGDKITDYYWKGHIDEIVKYSEADVNSLMLISEKLFKNFNIINKI